MTTESGLATAVASSGDVTALGIAHAIEQAVVGFAPQPPQDDVAVIVLRAGQAA